MLIAQIVTLYFLSRQSINELFHTLRIFIKSEKRVLTLVTVFFLPGTILHEMAHFFGATLLMLKVKEVTILPQRKNHYVKLGSVLYEKKDVIRGVLVGISPFFFAMFFFWLTSKTHIFPHPNLIVSILSGYGIFVVTSTMFSSSKDLQDLLFVIPLGIIVIGILYILNIRIEFMVNRNVLETVERISSEINIYLFSGIVMHVCLIVFLKSLRRIIHR